MTSAPSSGWWWVRLSSTTSRGADRRWKVYRVIEGAVQPAGTSAWYSPSAKWLRGAEWVPAPPPPESHPPEPAITPDGPTTRRRAAMTPDREERVRQVAAEIVGVFLELSDSMAAYYRRHPGHLADIVEVVTRIVLKLSRQ